MLVSGITLSPDGNILAVGVSTFADDITDAKTLTDVGSYTTGCR